MLTGAGSAFAAPYPPLSAIVTLNGATFTTPAIVTIGASASDSDGSVTNVQFFDGATSLGNDTTSPYSVTANLAAGSHALTAVTTDNLGLSSKIGRAHV